jgi:hypothetical protein
VLIRINQITRGWVNYFKHAVCKTTLKACCPPLSMQTAAPLSFLTLAT